MLLGDQAHMGNEAHMGEILKRIERGCNIATLQHRRHALLEYSSKSSMIHPIARQRKSILLNRHVLATESGSGTASVVSHNGLDRGIETGTQQE